MKKKLNLVPAHQIVSLMPPIIFDGPSERSQASNLCPMVQSVKSSQKFIEEHSSSKLPFGPHSLSAITIHTRVGAEDVIKMKLLSQRQDVGNRPTSYVIYYT